MKTELTIPGDASRESMLTYAVLGGQQARKNDRYALGALLTDMAVRGHFYIGEATPTESGLYLRAAPDSDLLEEEEAFVALLERDCMPDDNKFLALDAVTNNASLANHMNILWERVVMMHHVNYNQTRPLFNADPTRLIKWQRFRRTWGWVLAVGSVYAEPGWQGHVAGAAETLKGYEKPEPLGNTSAGSALYRKMLMLRKQMLQLTESGKADTDINATSTYEKALPFAFLFNDALSEKWPTFLGRHYTEYPSWLKPVQLAEDVAGRQAHIASMVRVMGTLCFPGRKRKGRPL